MEMLLKWKLLDAKNLLKPIPGIVCRERLSVNRGCGKAAGTRSNITLRQCDTSSCSTPAYAFRPMIVLRVEATIPRQLSYRAWFVDCGLHVLLPLRQWLGLQLCCRALCSN
jgi:hypothetical protein